MENGLIWQNGSDYDFITRELIGTGRTDREFFIAVDKAYFRRVKSVKSPVITLRPGRGLVSFERDAAYINQTFQVIGFDPKSDKAVSGKTKAVSTDAMTSAVPGTGEWFITDPACTSASAASNRTAVLARHALDGSQRAEIGCIGMPELIPGRFIRIDRVDSIVNKKYYITRVTHRFDYSGFTTQVETEGWE
jgi:phage protein D